MHGFLIGREVQQWGCISQFEGKNIYHLIPFTIFLAKFYCMPIIWKHFCRTFLIDTTQNFQLFPNVIKKDSLSNSQSNQEEMFSYEFHCHSKRNFSYKNHHQKSKSIIIYFYEVKVSSHLFRLLGCSRKRSLCDIKSFPHTFWWAFFALELLILLWFTI